MAKKRETWSFVEQPQWFYGDVIHREFVEGKKSDYVIQLGPPESLQSKGEPQPEIMAAVHLPLGTLGKEVFQRIEPRELERTETKILQSL